MSYTINRKLSGEGRLVLTPERSRAVTVITALAILTALVCFALALLGYQLDQPWLLRGGALLGTFFTIFGLLFAQRPSRSTLIFESGTLTVDDSSRGRARIASIPYTDILRLELREESRHISSGTSGRSSYKVYVVYLLRRNGSEWNLFESKVSSESEELIRTIRQQLVTNVANVSKPSVPSTTFRVSASDQASSITWRRRNGKLYRQIAIGALFLAMFNGAYYRLFARAFDYPLLEYGFPAVSILIAVIMLYGLISSIGAERSIAITSEDFTYRSRSAFGVERGFQLSTAGLRSVQFTLDTDAIVVSGDAAGKAGKRITVEKVIEDGLTNAEYIELEQLVERALDTIAPYWRRNRAPHHAVVQPFFENPATSS